MTPTRPFPALTCAFSCDIAAKLGVKDLGVRAGNVTPEAGPLVKIRLAKERPATAAPHRRVRHKWRAISMTFDLPLSSLGSWASRSQLATFLKHYDSIHNLNRAERL